MMTFDQKEVNAALRRMAGVLATMPAKRRVVLATNGRLAVTNGDVSVEVITPSMAVTAPTVVIPAAILRAGPAACAAHVADPDGVTAYAAQVAAFMNRATRGTACVDVAEIAARVAPFASDDETRYVLNGVYFDGKGHAVATDGHRMAVDHVGEHDVRGIVPIAAFTAWTRKDVCSMGTADGFAAITAGGVRVVARMIDGRFPDYQRVIPADGAGTRVALSENVRAAIKAHAKRGRTVGFRPDGTACVFEVPVVEKKKHGRCVYGPPIVHAEFACVPFAGDVVAANAEYLAEALATFPGDAWLTIPTDAYTPVKLHNDRLTHVIMPMREKVPACAGSSDVTVAA